MTTKRERRNWFQRQVDSARREVESLPRWIKELRGFTGMATNKPTPEWLSGYWKGAEDCDGSVDRHDAEIEVLNTRLADAERRAERLEQALQAAKDGIQGCDLGLIAKLEILGKISKALSAPDTKRKPSGLRCPHGQDPDDCGWCADLADTEPNR